MSIWKKLILSIIFVGFYFLILRPVRSFTAKMLKPTIEVQQLETHSQNSVRMTFVYKGEGFSKSFNFKMPFGVFFMFSIISLIFIDVNWKDFGILCAIQLSFWAIAFCAMSIGIKGNLFFLEIMDLIMRYLMPLFSLGFPAYLVTQEKMKYEEANYDS